MVAAFAGLGVTEAQIEKYVGRALKDLKHDDLNRLLGAFNAIKEGEQTKEELFGGAAASKPDAEKKTEQPNLIPEGQQERQPGEEG
jgi:hypothetical protein